MYVLWEGKIFYSVTSTIYISFPCGFLNLVKIKGVSCNTTDRHKRRLDVENMDTGKLKSGHPKLGHLKSGRPKLGHLKSGRPELGHFKSGRPKLGHLSHIPEKNW